MANQSLYRRYRPRRFSEVKGQDHVVRALRTAVAEGREGQAYLFSGPRGTGKTTSARILAKVLNCENPVDGEPCCACESCLAVERGTSYDVHELDAASNNGVEAMRDLIEKASLGTPGRHKVYILDEVHMLSKAAEAALLKTLEEPPPHVVFVLATTDPQKMSDTIRSRTQHLQFHLLAPDTLNEHVRWVADDAGLEVSDAAIEQVLRQGAGSARDALSALELLASIGDEGIDSVVLDEFVEAMIDRDPGRALTMVAHAIAVGRDARTLTGELIGFLRNGFLCLMAPELAQVSGTNLDALTDLASRLGAPGLVRGIETLGAALSEMRHAPDPRVLLDVAVVQLTADSVAPDLGALLTRLHRVEEQLASGTVPASAPAPASPATAAGAPHVDASTGRAALGGRARPASAEPVVAEQLPAERPPSAEQPVTAPAPTAPAVAEPPAQEVAAPEVADPPPANAASSGLTAELWEQSVRPALRGMAKAIYAPASFVGSDSSSVTFSLPNPAHRDKCEQHRATVEAAIQAAIGAPVSVTLLVEGLVEGSAGSPAPLNEPAPAPASRSAPPVAPAAPIDDAPVDDAAVEAKPPPVGAVVSMPEPPAPIDDPIDDEDVDLDDLVDAPPESVKSPIERLADAFPGSELIDERP